MAEHDEVLQRLADVTKRLDAVVNALASIARTAGDQQRTLSDLMRYVLDHERKLAACARCKNYEPHPYDRKRTEEISDLHPVVHPSV